MSLKGIYRNKENNDIRIVVERDYKKRDCVDFFYFMCSLGGGRINKEDLINNWIKE